MINPIAVAIPVFLASILGEMWVSWRQGRWRRPRPVYRLPDALTDLGCGLVSQVTGLFTSGVLLAGSYGWVEAGVPGQLPASNVLTWVGAFVAVDFLYYLWHRASHRVNLLWAAHVVHHQSEDYNLAVALRQAIFTSVTSIPFYLPLAVVGVPTVVFLTCLALNTLYQFWIHTRLVGRLGWFEAVFNTPSHHRVHHGINPEYIDKNHAGVFIVWDRWLGTFREERAEPVYGVVEGHESLDAVSSNFVPVAKLARLSLACRGWDCIGAWFRPPEWRPSYLGGPVVIPEPRVPIRFDPRVPRGVQLYALFTFFSQAPVLFALLWWYETAPAAHLWAGAGAIVAAQLTQTALLSGHRWAWPLEGARWVLTLALGGWLWFYF